MRSKQPVDYSRGYLVGYARVSTQDQKLEAQVQALLRYGVEPKWIFSEKISALAKRPEMARMWRELRPGDTLVVASLDRLGRSVRDLFNKMHELDQRGVRLVSLSENIDTSTAVGKLFIGMRAVFAEFERNLTAERTKRALAAKRERGEVVAPHAKIDVDRARKMLESGKSLAEVARRFKCSRSAIYQRFGSDELRAMYEKAKRRKAR